MEINATLVGCIFALGFLLGYAVREMISRLRRARAAKRIYEARYLPADFPPLVPIDDQQAEIDTTSSGTANGLWRS